MDEKEILRELEKNLNKIDSKKLVDMVEEVKKIHEELGDNPKFTITKEISLEDIEQELVDEQKKRKREVSSGVGYLLLSASAILATHLDNYYTPFILTIIAMIALSDILDRYHGKEAEDIKKKLELFKKEMNKKDNGDSHVKGK